MSAANADLGKNTRAMVDKSFHSSSAEVHNIVDPALKAFYPFLTGKFDLSDHRQIAVAINRDRLCYRQEAGVTVNRNPSEIDEAVWRAILRRDRNLDGKFVYAALTTGIYCRSSCPARHPHRRNTLIFSTAADAEREAFIACRRCNPQSNCLANLLTPAEICVELALNYIESHIEQNITLSSLSRVTGLSPNHLQQTFNRIVGLSPKAFCDARRLAHLKGHLKRGESVVRSIYAAGYGSSRALYERASKGLGMTPAVYARGGPGVRIRYAVVESRFGRTLIAVTKQGVCAVLSGSNGRQLVGRLKTEFPSAKTTCDRLLTARWLSTVRSCQSTNPLLSKLPLDMQRRVYEARIGRLSGR
jgi:AraC family transcriptional regulator of adaptative response/methylated-DNA-[protein]-cysteine methyltransferase